MGNCHPEITNQCQPRLRLGRHIYIMPYPTEDKIVNKCLEK